MLIFDGTIGADIDIFLTRVREETLFCTVMLYEDWLATHSNCSNHHEDHPDGIVYLRVSPEIAFTRIQIHTLSSKSALSFDTIQQIYQQKEDLFIEKKNNPSLLQHLPVLVLNGNNDFQTDFAQFYNHLFYIKKFLKEIQDQKDISQGIYKEKTPHRHCC
ncbi:MAG TPA: deoxynucleoside kinase [Candidatus Babeliales bacterium]|nr:deoxynucleoside kinase [Candidatus Babeliales bacterium]